MKTSSTRAGQTSKMTPRAAVNDPLPPVPRPITAKAKSRSWREPRVRNWWIGAIVLCAIALALAGRQITTWTEKTDFLRHARRVDVQIYWPGEKTAAGDLVPKKANVDLRYKEGEKAAQITGPLVDAPRDVHTGDIISIAFERTNPQVFTADVIAPNLQKMLIVPAILGALSVVSLIKSLMNRSAILNIWRTGKPFQAAVMTVHKTSQAPRSELVLAVMKDHPDRRVMRLFVPTHVSEYREGDVLWVVMPTNQPKSALPAHLYY